MDGPGGCRNQLYFSCRVDRERLCLGVCSVRFAAPSCRRSLWNKTCNHRSRSASAVVAWTCSHKNQIFGPDRPSRSHTHLFGTPRTSCSLRRWLDSCCRTIVRASNQRPTKPPVAYLRFPFDCLPTDKHDRRGNRFV